MSEQANFRHFVMDIAWFGIALAATTRFLSVYALRLGATPADLGWISALPALILLVSSSFGVWWQRHYGSPVRALFLPGLGMRFLFLLPVFAPFIPPPWQPLWLILSVSIPAIPQGIASVVFLVMMREGTAQTRMTHLLSRRQLALNIAVGVGALVFGFWLEKVAFPLNYQIMFLLAFLFALASLWHCLRLRIPTPMQSPQLVKRPTTNPWRSRGFLRVGFVAAVIHIAFFTLVPVVPLYLVQRLGANEGFMALFGIVELSAGALASIFTTRIAHRTGNRALIALAMIGTGIAALVIAFAPNLYITLIGAAISGACWTAGAGVGLFSFFMENTPADEAASYSTAYHQVIGLAVFIGPMIGSTLANGGVNLILVLTLGAALRLFAAPLIEYSLVVKRIHRHPVPHAL